MTATDLTTEVKGTGQYADVSGQRDGGWMGEGRPKGGHALAIIPGATHYNAAESPILVAAALAFLDAPDS